MPIHPRLNIVVCHLIITVCNLLLVAYRKKKIIMSCEFFGKNRNAYDKESAIFASPNESFT